MRFSGAEVQPLRSVVACTFMVLSFLSGEGLPPKSWGKAEYDELKSFAVAAHRLRVPAGHKSMARQSDTPVSKSIQLAALADLAWLLAMQRLQGVGQHIVAHCHSQRVPVRTGCAGVDPRVDARHERLIRGFCKAAEGVQHPRQHL